MATFFKTRNRRINRRQRQLEKLARMRSAKARKRQELICAGWAHEPRFVRAHLLEYGVRNIITGETHWRPLISARQAHKALGLILKFCK